MVSAAFMASRLDGEVINQKGRAFWGGLDEGVTVDIRKAQQFAQERFLASMEANPRDPALFPLVDLVDPALVRKGIFNDSYGLKGLEADIQKAMDDFSTEVNSISKATSTSSSLMHSFPDQDVTFLFKKIYPLQNLIDVESNRGKIATWDAIPPNGAGTASFISEDPVLTESDITDYTRTATCKILGSVGRITKMARIAGSTQLPARDMMSIRVMASMEMMKNLRERAIIGVTRDTASTANIYTPANTALEYKGLYEMITANTADPCYVTAAGGTDTWTEISPYLDETYRRMISVGLTPNLAMCDYKTFGIIRRGMNDFYRSESMIETTFGISKINLVFPGAIIPLVPNYFMPTTTGANGSCFVLDTSYLKRRVLWPDMYTELANENGSQKYLVDAAEVIIDKTDVNGTSSLQGGVFGITVA